MQDPAQRIDGTRGRSGLLIEDLAGSATHLMGLCWIAEQFDQYLREFLLGRDADGVVGTKIIGDGAEVYIVRTHHDRHSELRRL